MNIKGIASKNFIEQYAISEHEVAICKYFGKENLILPNETFSDKRQNCFICFTNRCGSNFLSEIMGSTNIFGRAGEFWNAETVIHQSQEKKFKYFSEHFKFLQNKIHKTNQIFTSKIGWQQLAFFIKIGLLQNIVSKSKFIFIQRKNILDQAISFSIADQTKRWTSTQKETNIMPRYDEADIYNRMQGILKGNLMFKKMFELFQLNYTTVYYNSLQDNSNFELLRIIDFIKPTHKIIRINKNNHKLKIQRNEINKEFKKLFIANNKLSI